MTNLKVNTNNDSYLSSSKKLLNLLTVSRQGIYYLKLKCQHTILWPLVGSGRITAHNWKLVKSCFFEGNKPEKHVGNIIFLVSWLFERVKNIRTYAELKFQHQIRKMAVFRQISNEIKLLIYKNGRMRLRRRNEEEAANEI